MNLAASKNGFTTTTQEKDYVLGQSGAVETVLTMAQGGAMQWDHSNVYANGELVGAYTQTGLHFYLHDWQGTVRAVTDYAGVVEETCPSLPFGDTLGVQQNSACPQQDSFAGLSGSRQTRLDDAVWRSYSPATGRWMSPDPYNGSYSLTNPQSFDRYAYVGNNPLGFEDPSGLACSSPENMGVNPQGILVFGVGCVTTRFLGNSISLLLPHLADIIPFVGWSMVATEFIGRLAGWWGPPQFHGSLKPRPKTPGTPKAPNNGRTTCSGPATFTAVGGNQAEGDGALYSKYPALAGGSIRGGTFGTVAVQDGFLGLTTRQLRMYGTQIFITPSNQGLISQYGGPTGPLSVSDYGDANIQATSGVAFDLYRFPTVSAGMQFGRQTMNTTISYPNNSGASCPAGYTVVP
jgi:RHS repeat-associated protein